MSVSFLLASALSPDMTRDRIVEAKEKYKDVLDYFWISEIGESSPALVYEDRKYHFIQRCNFIVQWNKERSELIPMIPRIFYEIFGIGVILIRNDSYDVIPPP